MVTLSHRARVGAWIASGVLGGAVIAGVAVAQFGVATAASPSPRPSAPSGPFAKMRGMHHGLLGRLGARVLHGEATVRGADGTDKVVEFQNGTISAINGSSITVTSVDGFTSSYTVDKTTRIVLNGTQGALSTLKTGDQVRVLAVKSGDATATAKSVIDGMPVRPMWSGRGARGGPGAADLPGPMMPGGMGLMPAAA